MGLGNLMRIRKEKDLIRVEMPVGFSGNCK